MLVTPMTASVDDLLRRGRITAALHVLSAVSQPSVVELAATLECRLARGELDLAIGIGDRLSSAGVPGDEAARAESALGSLAAATGSEERAVAHYLAAGDLATTDDPVSNPWRAGAALSLVRTGARREAEQLARAHLELVRATDSAYAEASGLRTVAAVCPTVDGLALLRRALGLASGEYDRLAAQVATDLAGLLAFVPPDRHAHAEAVSLLRTAEEYADLEDLWPLHARVRRLLERLDEPVSVPRAEAIARLTDAELRIARLAATGTTNRSIAERLGVGVKAVEWHLSHTYRKLGITGRGELRRALRIVS